MENLYLYNYYRSSTSYRARLALHLKNLNFEYKPIHLLNGGGEQHTDSYRRLNPIGGVPTLVHNDQVISQSMAIIEYLDEAFPNTPKLFSGTAYDRAKIRQICENINADIHPLQNLKVMQHLEKQHQYTQEQKNLWCQKWIIDGLTATEKIIQSTGQGYCYGSEITAADLFLIPQLFSAERFQVNLSPFETLTRIQKKCEQHPAFQKAHPYAQIDTPDEFKIK